MKKYLLIAVAMLISISSMAVDQKKMVSSKISMKKEIMAKMNLKPVQSVKGETKFFYSSQNSKLSQEFAKTVNRAESNIKLEPAYSLLTYRWSYTIKSPLMLSMYSDAYYAVDGDNAYVTLFGTESTIFKGTKNTDIDNPYAEIGGVPYVFDLSTVSVKFESDQTNYILRSGSEDNEGNIVRNEETSVVGYYFQENNELYIPDFIGVWNTDPTVTDPEDGFAGMDLQQQKDLSNMFYKATYHTVNFMGKESDGDAEIVFANDYFFVKGIVPYVSNAWVMFKYDSEDGSSAKIPAFQYIEEGMYWDDDTKTSTHPELWTTLGVSVDSKGTISYPNEDYSSTFFVDEDKEKNVVTIASDGISNTAIRIMGDPQGGYYGDLIFSDLTISTSFEPIATNIANVSSYKTATTAYYDMQGRKASVNQKGMLIKKSTMADGSVKSVKIMNK